jgi:hypothetical protein
MNKAELYARYENYGVELIPVSEAEYFLHHSQENKEKIRHHGEQVECFQVILDGVTYMWYSCMHNVGWQGDVEGHSFYCKKITITNAEMEKLAKIFSQAPQEIHEQFN